MNSRTLGLAALLSLIGCGQMLADMLRLPRLKAAMQLCEQKQDYVSRDMLLGQLQDTEEDHAHWIEQQLGLIDKIGLPNYLQSQMG